MKCRKMVSLLMAGVIASGMLAGCGSGSGSGADSQTQAPAGTAQWESGSQATAEEEVTLHLFGPGLLSTVGENGSIDLISGLEMPGYQVIVDRWMNSTPT